MMMSLWPHWQRPYFLLLLPFFIWLLWRFATFHINKGSWHKLLPSFLHPWLLRGESVEKSSIPEKLLGISAILALLALMGPSFIQIEQPPLKVDSPMVIILDLTTNMLSKDVPPSRLQSAKTKIETIIDARKDAQTALVLYSGSAHVAVPLSDDRETFNNLLSSISPSIMPINGKRADLGVKKAIELLVNSQQYQGAQLLLVTTSLSSQEQTNIQEELTKQKSIALNILGVGTAQGAPIMTESGSFLQDKEGNVVIPRLDSISLQNFAYAQGGYYSTITLDDGDIQKLKLTNVKDKYRTLDKNQTKQTKLWQDQGYWLLLPLLLIASLGARKGWLFCIPLLFLFQTQPTYAFELNQLLLNKNQQGQQLLKENKPKEAAKRFQDKQWKAYSQYQADNYQQAEKLFANDKTPEGAYNYGNALARQGKYKEAIAAWDKAIQEKPDFQQAITNKNLVEELLKKQEEEKDQQQEQKPQNKDDQKENEQAAEGEESDDEQQQFGQPSEQKQEQNSKPKPSQDQPPTGEEDKDSENPDANDDNAQNGQKNQPVELSKTEQSDSNKPEDADAIQEAEMNQDQTYDPLKQQLRQIPDDPSELLRTKFYYEQRSNRGNN